MGTTTRTAPSAARERRHAALVTPTDLDREGTRGSAAALNRLPADVYALYIKTKNFHWHMSGPHFRDYHLLLDEQGDQIFAMTDPIAERVRKLGEVTLHSIGEIARLQRVEDNDAEYVEPADMLAELREDTQSLTARMREAHDVCDDARLRQREPAGGLDRRDREADLVPVRGGAGRPDRRALERSPGARWLRAGRSVVKS